MDSGEWMEQSKYVQKPQNYGNHHHRIQNGFDRALHRYETINQPQQKTHHHQNDEYLK